MGFYRGTCKHDKLSMPLSALFFLKRMGEGGAENSKLLIMAQSFQWPALTKKPTQSFLISTKDAPVTQETSRGSRALYQELGAKKNICIFCHLT